MRCTVIRIFLFIAGLLFICGRVQAQCGLSPIKLILTADSINGAPVDARISIENQPLLPGWQLLSTNFVVDGQQTISDTILEIKSIPTSGIHYAEARQTAYNPTTGDTCTQVKGGYYLTAVQNLFSTIETNGSGLTQGFQARLYGSEAVINPVWNFGDGTLMNGISAAHTYAVPGVYKVTFVTGNGTLSSASRWIHVGDGQSNFSLTAAGLSQPACDSVFFQPVTQTPYSFISADDIFNYNFQGSTGVLTGTFSGYNQWAPAPVTFQGRYHLPGQTLLNARMLDNAGADYTIYVPVLINDSCFPPADTLSGYFWKDDDADGIRDPLEPLISEPTFGVQTFSHLVQPDFKGKYKLPLPGIRSTATPVTATGENFTTPEQIVCDPSSTGMHQILNCGLALQQSLVTGKLFFDIDKDTLFNGTTDRFLEGYTFEIKNTVTGSVYVAVTNGTGDFKTLVPYGNYYIRLQTEVPGSKLLPDTQVVSISSATTGLIPFAVQSVQPTADLEALLIPGSTPVAGAPFELYLLARNNGNDTCKGQFQVVYDNNLLFTSFSPANGIHDPLNHTVTWYSQTLYPLTDSIYHIRFTLPSTAQGDSLVNQSYIYVNPGFNDINLQNNAYALTTKLGNQQDPFTLAVIPEGQGTQHYIPAGERTFYHVRYQHQGPGILRNLILQDELSPWLDLSSFRVAYASHAYQIINRGHHCTFKFYNINLPDTGNAAVIDFVFSLETYPFVPGGTIIDNFITAYADQQIPAVSNTVFQTIDLNAGIQPSENTNVRVYPNPFSNEIIIAAAGYSIQNVRMSDLTGREVPVQYFAASQRISTARLSQGIYFLSIETGRGTEVFRLTKN